MQAPQRRRIDETILPTSYSDVRYYLRCPADYRFRKTYGFSPPITEMFGFGRTVHASIGKLHETFSEGAPDADEARKVAEGLFHLKHVPPSRDPVNKPGPYERAREKAGEIAGSYVSSYSEDFARRRQIEVRFEIPVDQAVITGAIDLMLKESADGRILEASVIDFKAMEGGPDPSARDDLHWTELSLQVQLYARAALEVLGENAQTGAVHLLKDQHRVDVPIDDGALDAAVANVEWSVDRIISGDFPRRPFAAKCEECDFQRLCPQSPEAFGTPDEPPEISVPGPSRQMARAFSEFDPTHERK
ncbi:MAG TPA: PD-(D/E)XK nuclease family protein [Actinomycetota bacterium]|nr:PD-(D/E)XK nuclease family protein [Actinomycetota bacterium]